MIEYSRALWRTSIYVVPVGFHGLESDEVARVHALVQEHQPENTPKLVLRESDGPDAEVKLVAVFDCITALDKVRYERGAHIPEDTFDSLSGVASSPRKKPSTRGGEKSVSLLGDR